MLARSAFRPRKRNSPRPAEKSAKGFLQWLRGRECVRFNFYCEGKIEAAHTPDPMTKGMSTKAADCNAIPLCRHHHKLQHDKGWSAIGLTRETAAELADAYWRNWPGRIAWEAKNNV